MNVSALQGAVAGMIAHQDHLAEVADRVSRWRRTDAPSGPAPVDLVREVVKLKTNVQGFETGAAEASTADRLSGLLLDTYA